MEHTIDPVVFWDRLSKLHKAWNVRLALPKLHVPCARPGPASTCCLQQRHNQNPLLQAWHMLTCRTGPHLPVNPTPQAARDPDGLWKGADALVIDSGALNDEELYSKSAALQIWLLGIEFTNTVIVVCSRSIHVLTDAKKGSLLAPLKTAENATLPLDVHVKDKADKNKANYDTLIKAIKSSHTGSIVACLLKEKPLGEFSSLWRAALDAAEGLQQVELCQSLAQVLSVKDLDEQVLPLHCSAPQPVRHPRTLFPGLNGRHRHDFVSICLLRAGLRKACRGLLGRAFDKAPRTPHRDCSGRGE